MFKFSIMPSSCKTNSACCQGYIYCLQNLLASLHCPILVLFIILKYKSSGFRGTRLFFLFFAKMTTQTFDDLTDKLQRTYNAVLLHIVHEIEIAQEKEIHFYFSRHIPRGITGTLDILRSLENAGKISWRDALSSAEASHSRALGKNIPATRGGWEEEKLKRIVPRAPVFSLQRSRSRFFLWCLLTGASAEERVERRMFPKGRFDWNTEIRSC